MKNRSIKSIFGMFFAAALMATSCQDMLTPDLERFSDDFAKDSVYSAFGILKSIQKVGVRTVVLDEARSDLSTTGTYTTDSVLSIANFENPKDGTSAFLNAADYYHIINSCNFYLAKVDTITSKNSSREMLRETAQVMTLRAWTYLQLVRLYGSVPFITEPIENSDEAKALEQSAKRASKENLITLLRESNIERAYELQMAYGMPNYGTVNNGSNDYNSQYFFIPVQLVIADAYLMSNVYDKAAEYYYDYFKNVYHLIPDGNKVGYSKSVVNDVATYQLQSSGWLSTLDRSRIGSEIRSVTVGAANTTFGHVITDLQNVFGFATSSSQSTSLAEGEEDASKASTSASVSITPNETYQQILPSENYKSLNEAQSYCMYEFKDGESLTAYQEEMCDGRLDGTAPFVQLTRGEDKYRIINKFCPASFGLNTKEYGGGKGMMGSMSAGGFSMNYAIPLYRMTEVYLRFAEAINRLGFPQLAFGILKDGLLRENFPTVDFKDMNEYFVNVYTDAANVEHKDSAIVIKSVEDPTVLDTIYFSQYDEEGDTLIFIDPLGRDGREYIDTSLFNRPYFSELPTAVTGGMYYLSLDEMVRSQQYPFLDFYSHDRWSDPNLEVSEYVQARGIHSRGCGYTAGRVDTVYTFARQVAKKVAENRARLQGLSYAQQQELEASLCVTRDSLVADLQQDEIINAVEDLIVDECALETAFEGHRFTDLVRFADHKTDGASWLAWKVARRNVSVKADATEKDESLYQKLLNRDNWFFKLPE